MKKILIPLLALGACMPFYQIKEALATPPSPPHIDAMGPLSEPPPNVPMGDARFFTPAKGIDHATGGTETPFFVLDGVLRVEDIQRDDAEGQLRARVRLRNLADFAVNAEYLIVFYDDLGHRLVSECDKWSGFVVEGFGSQTLWNGCLLKDADRFTLYVRHGQPVRDSRAPVNVTPSSGAPMTPGGGDERVTNPVFVDIVPGGLRATQKPRVHSPSDR